MSSSEHFEPITVKEFANANEFYAFQRFLKRFLDGGSLAEVSSKVWLEQGDSVRSYHDRYFLGQDGTEYIFRPHFNFRPGAFMRAARSPDSTGQVVRSISTWEENSDFCRWLKQQLDSGQLVEVTLQHIAESNGAPWLDHVFEATNGMRYELKSPDPQYWFYGWFGPEGAYS